jgi:hypothetical protein
MFDHTNDIRSMPTACTFSVIGMDRSVLESFDSGLHEAGFVERVCVDKTLDIEFVADCETGVNG